MRLMEGFTGMGHPALRGEDIHKARPIGDFLFTEIKPETL